MALQIRNYIYSFATVIAALWLTYLVLLPPFDVSASSFDFDIDGDTGGITTPSTDPADYPTSPDSATPDPGSGGSADAGTGGGNGDTPATVTTPDAEQTVFRLLFNFVSNVGGWIVGIAGSMFDYAIANFILGFGEKYNTTNIGAIIDSLWGIIRDIFNLTFIFGLVYIGFQMILGNISNAQRSLGYLIAAALLVNFSLFITKFVVDFTNIAAAQIYKGFDFAEDASIGSQVLNIIGLSAAFNDLPTGVGYSYIIGLFLFLIVTAFVFIAGAVMITIRYIALNLYLVFSPVMFLGWVFPGLGNFSRDYWRGFLNRSFFAPAFIFMIYLSFMILNSYNDSIARNNIGGAFRNGGTGLAESAGGSVAFFALAMGFMIASLVVAQKMGAHGAATAINVGHRVRRGAQSYVGRNTIGWAATGAEKLNNRLESSRTGRNLKRFTSVATLGAVTERERRNLINAGKNAKFGGTYSAADDQKFIKERNATRSKVAKERSTNADISAGQATAKELADLRAKRDSGVALSAAENTRVNELERTESKMRSAITGLSTEQIENMSVAERNKIAHEFTASQVEKLEKSEKLTTADVEGVSSSRVNKIKEKIGATAATINPREVTKLSNGQIETLGADWILENGYLLSNSQFDKIVKDSKEFTENQKSTFSASRKAKFEEIARTGSASDIDRVFAGIENKPKEIVELPTGLVINKNSLKYISESVLRELANRLEGPDKTTLQGLITGNPGMAHASAVGYFTSAHGVRNW